MSVDERLQAHLDKYKVDGVVSMNITLDPLSPAASNRELLKEELCDFFDECNDPTKCRLMTPKDFGEEE